MNKIIILLSITIFLLSSCGVSSKKFQATNLKISKRVGLLDQNIKSLNDDIAKLEFKIRNLENLFMKNNDSQIQKVNQLEQEIYDFETKNKNLKDLMSKLRIEVAKLKKQLE